MNLFVVFACLLAGCLAQKPHPCKSPPLLTGAVTTTSQNEKLFIMGKYLYDALGERIRLQELVTLDNQTASLDILLHYKQRVIYEINDNDRTCKKIPLKAEFMPFGVPDGATFVAQNVLGDSSKPGDGLLVNTWTGNMPSKAEKFLTTVTEFGCIPITFSYQTKQYGWLWTYYFDNVIGITDPNLLNPPSYCPDEDTMTDEEPVGFFNLFL
ncbi:ependymin-like [Xyrichtys novacula]|uniref:Ependymin-like n=1 Tax=Xyrichtys novacula TaxID=13765 RepID=A0AAV1HL84_XYRNO|nr:ependymin-like [Xyrichtys novacula]